jgi:hypothetical protein
MPILCKRVTTHVRQFDYTGHTGWGFMFDCDAAGTVDEAALNPDALRNWQLCTSGRLDVVDRGVQTYERHFTIRLCECGSGLESEWLTDGNGIALCRACSRCKDRKLARYNPAVLRPYSQADIDEPIEPEEY